MIQNVHYIELYINGQLMELQSQESLNLRINSVLFIPTEVKTTQAEYSFSFDLPSTPHNDRILNYANNFSRINKYHTRYPAEVYADGELIFEGSLTNQKYSAKDKMYTCNLVNIKVETLEELFGEQTLTDLKWEVPFDGAPTINAVNDDFLHTKYFFPFVNYGTFQKDYIRKDDVSATYTPKHTLDKYNRWYYNSIYPSLNMMEILRKAYESKGFTVAGSAFSDPFIKNIYCSTNLANDQEPKYNLGNPKFGTQHLTVTWDNYLSYDADNGGREIGQFEQDLTFPYERIYPAINAKGVAPDKTTVDMSLQMEPQYNFSTIECWNMLDSINNSHVTINRQSDTYMYDPNELGIMIPQTGWYRITMTCDMKLSGEGTSFSATQWTTTYESGDEFKEREVPMERHMTCQQTPLEIQLIRNYNNNIELIKGKRNIEYKTGYPLQEQYSYKDAYYKNIWWYVDNSYPNKEEWITDCPHQDPYGAKDPTKTQDMINSATASRNDLLKRYGLGEIPTILTNGATSSGSFGTIETRGGTFGHGTPNTPSTETGGSSSAHFGGRRGTKYNTIGFVHKDGRVMPYDQAVSTAFICGFSSLSDGTVSVMRNGYSWSSMSAARNRVFANVEGLDLVKKLNDSGETETIETDYCKNEYKDIPNTDHCTVYDGYDGMFGTVTCCAYLTKGDFLSLVAIQRAYKEGQMYATSGTVELDITAMSERSEDELRADPDWGYHSPVEFPYNLNLFNFTNSETKISDWISNIQKAFNLEITQEGNNIDISTNQGYKKDINYVIDIDDRVSNDEGESEYISYPREMSVKYKIDTDEYGFELTVPAEHIDDEGDEWKKWGDSGFSIINLSDDSYETKVQNIQTNFSYTYYDNFLWKDVQEDGTERDWSGTTITIPTIAKSQYMADGYNDEEGQKHDGYSLTQRFWYRDQPSQEYIYLSNHMREKIYLCYPMNQWNDFNLSYKDTEKSILTEYFNVDPMLSSNYVNIDLYITPEEYKAIKGGAKIRYDNDLYYVSQVEGYDPSGYNLTSLKLIKKT